MRKIFIELRRLGHQGRYLAHVLVNGHPVDVSHWVDYKTVKAAIKDKTGFELPLLKDFIFDFDPDKACYRAFLDGTQPTPHGCMVTLNEIKKGWKPKWD